jgi:hypothetical protein
MNVLDRACLMPLISRLLIQCTDYQPFPLHVESQANGLSLLSDELIDRLGMELHERD